jgi:hypothetical protein
VLGIPWYVGTEGLQDYMGKFRDLEDVIVMQDHAIGHFHGFGYAIFASVEDAKKALDSEHVPESIELKQFSGVSSMNDCWVFHISFLFQDKLTKLKEENAFNIQKKRITLLMEALM